MWPVNGERSDAADKPSQPHQVRTAMDYQKPTIDPNKTYSVFEASELMGVCGETIRLKIKKGKLKAARVDNGPWRISGESLAKMMAPLTAIQPATLPTNTELRRLAHSLVRPRKARGRDLSKLLWPHAPQA